MWIMQFVLLLRLKLDLYKSSGKLLKDFYVHPVDKCVCPRQYFVCIIWNIFWWLCSTFLFHLSRSSFVHFLHFRGKYLLVETFRHYSRNCFNMFVTSLNNLICFEENMKCASNSQCLYVFWTSYFLKLKVQSFFN